MPSRSSSIERAIHRPGPSSFPGHHHARLGQCTRAVELALGRVRSAARSTDLAAAPSLRPLRACRGDRLPRTGRCRRRPAPRLDRISEALLLAQLLEQARRGCRRRPRAANSASAEQSGSAGRRPRKASAICACSPLRRSNASAADEVRRRDRRRPGPAACRRTRFGQSTRPAGSTLPAADEHQPLGHDIAVAASHADRRRVTARMLSRSPSTGRPSACPSKAASSRWSSNRCRARRGLRPAPAGRPSFRARDRLRRNAARGPGRRSVRRRAATSGASRRRVNPVGSRSVEALRSPPTSSIASLISRAERPPAPLNTICSNRCATPFEPSGSSRDPTPAYRPTATVSTPGIGSTRHPQRHWPASSAQPASWRFPCCPALAQRQRVDDQRDQREPEPLHRVGQ